MISLPYDGSTVDGARGVLKYEFMHAGLQRYEVEGRFKIVDTIKDHNFGEPYVAWIPKGGKKDAWRGCCRLSEVTKFTPHVK
jgi:hypothetical protein